MNQYEEDLEAVRRKVEAKYTEETLVESDRWSLNPNIK